MQPQYTTEQLSGLLYCIAMESETAFQMLPELCKRLGVEFPPKLEPVTKRDIPDPFLTESLS